VRVIECGAAESCAASDISGQPQAKTYGVAEWFDDKDFPAWAIVHAAGVDVLVESALLVSLAVPS
jgi:hypothetical protein